MGIPEKVAVLISSEVERRVHEELCRMAERVAELYQVPLKIVRKDLLGEEYCKGVKRDGKLCVHKSCLDGYCMKHVNDTRPTEPINSERPGARHNHPFPSAPRSDCPACHVKKEGDNQFRDLASMM
jgi:hypothetical protein